MATRYDFSDVDHAAGYLNGSIVRWDGQPTYVHTISRVRDTPKLQLLVNHAPLSVGAERTDAIHKLDFSPMNIGMYNVSIKDQFREAIWMERIPARRWKVGVTKSGLRHVPVRTEADNIWWSVLKEGGGFKAWNLNRDMIRMLMKDYPKYDEVMEQVRKYTRMSVAFSANFAVMAQGNKLMYRRHPEPVGKCRALGPDLQVKYKFLKEILQEDLRNAR